MFTSLGMALPYSDVLSSRCPARGECDGDLSVESLATELIAQEELHEDDEPEPPECCVDLAREGNADLLAIVLDVGEELR